MQINLCYDRYCRTSPERESAPLSGVCVSVSDPIGTGKSSHLWVDLNLSWIPKRIRADESDAMIVEHTSKRRAVR